MNDSRGITIANCMKQMTSKDSTENAIREIIEFHVEAALKAAAENVLVEAESEEGKISYNKSFEVGPYNRVKVNYFFSVNRESILNAYPLTNIK